jgi:hypothetical protein
MKKDQRTTIFRAIAIFIIALCLLTIGLKAFVISKFSLGADYYTFWQAGKALFL